MFRYTPRTRSTVLYGLAALLFVLSFALMFGHSIEPVSAEVLPAETVTDLPTQPPPTDTPTDVPTATATSTPTELPPQTVTPPPTPLPPAEIPEPITVILFGTGLAALSAAAARRKKTE